MKHLVVGFDGRGPRSRAKAIEDARFYGGGGLYLAIGRCEGQWV